MTEDPAFITQPRKLKQRPRQISSPLHPSGRDRCSSTTSSRSKRSPSAHHPAQSHYTIRALPPRSILRQASLELKFRSSTSEHHLKPPKPARHVYFDLDDKEKPCFRSRSTPPTERSFNVPYEGGNLTELDRILRHSPPSNTIQDGPTCDHHQETISRRRNGQRRTYNFMHYPECDGDESKLPCSPTQTELYPHQLRERVQSSPPSQWVSNAIKLISREEREQMSESGTLAQIKRLDMDSKSSSSKEDLSDPGRTEHKDKQKISVAHIWLCRKPKSSALARAQ